MCVITRQGRDREQRATAGFILDMLGDLILDRSVHFLSVWPAWVWPAEMRKGPPSYPWGC